MADAINSVNTLLEQTATAKDKSSTNALDKDAFLQLLATQMRYQDPLNPNTDTEFVAQLATFTQLEQMQNLNTTSTNSQAFGLVGKSVIMKEVDTSGNTSYISGKIDFATMTNGKAYLSINGSLYPASELDTVLDEAFIDSLGLPSVTKADLSYDKAAPKDQSFKVNLGNEDNVAKKATIKINEIEVEEKYVSIDNNILTIKKEALTDLGIGAYKVQVIFDDISKTTISDMVTITVKDSSK